MVVPMEQIDQPAGEVGGSAGEAAPPMVGDMEPTTTAHHDVVVVGSPQHQPVAAVLRLGRRRRAGRRDVVRHRPAVLCLSVTTDSSTYGCGSMLRTASK